MTGPDLIRLAEDLAQCGGIHRLTNCIAAACHVFAEHERRARACVEAWEDGPEIGCGMSDKVVREPKRPCPQCGQTDRGCYGGERGGECVPLNCAWMSEERIERYDADSRRPVASPGDDGWSGGSDLACEATTRSTVPSRPRSGDLTSGDANCAQNVNGGIVHALDSPIAAEFPAAPEYRLVPRHMPPIDPTIAAEDPA